MTSSKVVRESYRKFPTLFELQDVKISIAQLECFIAKMEREKTHTTTAEEFESDIRSGNVLAYLYLRRLQVDKARPFVEDALQREPCNVTALANKCELHLQLFEITEAEATLKAMKKESENKEAIATALSELAYGLSRIGPFTHLRAISKFAEAIEMGQGLCSPEKIVSWQYGMALTYNRTFDLEYQLENPHVDLECNYRTAVMALSDVIKSDHKFLKPKAYVVLGEIAKKYWSIFKRDKSNTSNKMVTLPEEQLTVYDCFKRASELAPEDHWVLERLGRQLRHMKQYEQALEVLNRACDLYPSAFVCHHQGLTYRAMAGRGRGYSGDRGYSRGRGHFRSRGYPHRGSSHLRGVGNRLTATAKLDDLFPALSLEDKEQPIAHDVQAIEPSLVPVPYRGGRTSKYHLPQPPGHLNYLGTCDDQEQRGRGNRVAPHSYRGRNKSVYDTRYQRQNQGLSNNIYPRDPRYRPMPQQPIAFPASSGLHNVTDQENNYLDLAIECIKKGIDLSNETAHSLLVTLAQAYSSTGKHEEADECFHKALAENIYVTHFSRARTLETLGLAMLDRGMQEKSYNYFRMAIEYAAKVKMRRPVAFDLFMRELMECRNPTAEDLVSQSHFFALVGRYSDALKLLYEAHSMKQDPEVQYSIIKNLAAKKDYQKALTACAMLQCTDSADIIDDRDLVDISFGAVKQRMKDLSLQNSDVLRNIYDRLLNDSTKQHEVFIFHDDDDDNNIALAENVQELAKEMAQVECIPLCHVPAGQHLVASIPEVPESYDAIIVLVTPEFVKNDRTKKLCLYLLQGSCVLLCLRMPCVSENDIPKALKPVHQAILPQELCCEAFKQIDQFKKHDVWREIFEALCAAKIMDSTED